MRIPLFLACIFLMLNFSVSAQTSDFQDIQSDNVDLDGDGNDEHITMQYDAWAGHFILKVNDEEVETWLEPELTGFEIIDIDESDDYLEIMIETWGPSDDPECLIYGYDGWNLALIGDIYGWRDIRGDGTIFTDIWRGFWSSRHKYILNMETWQLDEVPQAMYYVDECFGLYDTGCAYEVTEDFILYDYPASEFATDYVRAGATITVVACMPTIGEYDEYLEDYYNLWEWYLLRTDEGILGWSRLWDFSACVDGMSFAD